MVTTKVTRNGQITLGKDLREELGIREGTKLVVNRIGDTIMIKKVDEDSWDNIKSFLPKNFDETLKEMRKDSTDRYKRLFG